MWGVMSPSHAILHRRTRHCRTSPHPELSLQSPTVSPTFLNKARQTERSWRSAVVIGRMSRVLSCLVDDMEECGAVHTPQWPRTHTVANGGRTTVKCLNKRWTGYGDFQYGTESDRRLSEFWWVQFVRGLWLSGARRGRSMDWSEDSSHLRFFYDTIWLSILIL